MKMSNLKNHLKILGLISSFFYFSHVNSQTVSTVAGSTVGFVDGTGTASKFNGPSGVAVDNNGTLFVADRINHRIRKITSSGVVTTFAGSGVSGFLDATGTAAQFDYPTDVAIDVNGNVFVADASNHRIRKISSSGVVTTLAGSTDGYADGTGSAAQFSYPEGITVDNSGNLYVADAGNHRIRKITSTGVVTTLAGSTFGYADGIGAQAQFKTPCGVAIDVNGIVYVAEKQNHRIRKISPNGTVTTFAGSGTTGNTNGTGIAAEFNAPFNVDVDSEGNVYVADASNYRIRKITAVGVVTTLAGSTSGYLDGVGSTAKFVYPVGVCVATNGIVYIGDSGGHKIRKISSTLEIDMNQLENRLSVYPNPASSIINLEMNDLIVSELTIFDMSGKSVEFKDNFNNENSIYIGDLQNGVYTIQVISSQGTIYKKFIKN